MRALIIDMTPLVDLGFLLISFFVFTTSLMEPSVMNLVVPKDKGVTDSSELPESLALTVLLDEQNRVFCYPGKWEKAIETGAVMQSDYSGIGEMIRNRQKVILKENKFPEGKNGLMLLIKPSKAATYKNLVDVLDEVIINEVKKYAVVDLTPEESVFLRSKEPSGH